MQVSTGNVACGQPWLRNQAIDSTVRDPGVEVDSALEIAEKFEVWNTCAELSCSACTEKVCRKKTTGLNRVEPAEPLGPNVECLLKPAVSPPNADTLGVRNCMRGRCEACDCRSAP